MLHLGEAALALGRNTDYEIPFLKRQAAKYQQQLGDLERKQAEALRSAAAAAADFQQVCDAGRGGAGQCSAVCSVVRAWGTSGVTRRMCTDARLPL